MCLIYQITNDTLFLCMAQDKKKYYFRFRLQNINMLMHITRHQ